jgi:iron-sulfur cluster repair protein YtfE (RIC family)
MRVEVRKFESGDGYSEPALISQLADLLEEHFRREGLLLIPILRRSLGSDICDRLRNEETEIMSTAKGLCVQNRLLEQDFSQLEQMFSTHVATEENVLFWYLSLQESGE